MENKKRKLNLNKRRIIILIVLAIIAFLIIFGMAKLILKLFSPEYSVGNYANMGLAIEDGNTVYYNKFEKGIVKFEKDKETNLTEETAYSMTLINDTIYYLTISSSNTIDLNSVKTNGENLTKIKTLYTSISKFYIDDGYVYYVSNKDNIGIYKLSLETSEESTVMLANVQDFVLDKDLIYFTDNVGFLHSVKLDGTDKKDISTDYNIKNIQILGKWIYYYDEINKKICKCDLKGEKSKEIVSLEATRTKINIANGVIYYLDNSKDESQIYQMYRVKENGKKSKAIEY